jgi:hypothetical protein
VQLALSAAASAAGGDNPPITRTPIRMHIRWDKGNGIRRTAM